MNNSSSSYITANEDIDKIPNFEYLRNSGDLSKILGEDNNLNCILDSSILTPHDSMAEPTEEFFIDKKQKQKQVKKGIKYYLCCWFCFNERNLDETLL